MNSNVLVRQRCQCSAHGQRSCDNAHRRRVVHRRLVLVEHTTFTSSCRQLHACSLAYNLRPQPQPGLHGCAVQVVATNKVLATQPYLCFFQGGPGFESPVPSEDILWLAAATKHFRVVLLDQRGTGCSAPLRASTLSPLGSAERQVEHLRHFRADSIVADAEAFRRALDTQTGDKRRWCILGQSFGGFCCINYLSTAPDGAQCIQAVKIDNHRFCAIDGMLLLPRTSVAACTNLCFGSHAKHERETHSMR